MKTTMRNRKINVRFLRGEEYSVEGSKKGEGNSAEGWEREYSASGRPGRAGRAGGYGVGVGGRCIGIGVNIINYNEI